MTGDSEPIRPDELDGLFAHLGGSRSSERLGIAVSGGSDSAALMVLFADWLRGRGADPGIHSVLTVDHGLRSESAGEAAAVARQAAALGFHHATLLWEGVKPQTGIQAAARAARYRLMAEHARAHDIGTLLTAHTRDDQAETLLMRLARGSGLDGLAAIAPSTYWGRLRIVRPLLGVPKSRLVATLRARAIPWIEDPSNQSPAFERTRVRAAQAQLDALGLTGEMLGLSARRLQRARAALDSVTESYCAEPPQGVVRTHPCGVFHIELRPLLAAPDEIMLRVIERCVAAAGGLEEPVPLSKLEAVVAGLRQAGSRREASEPGAWTLSRAIVTVAAAAIEIEREPGRQPLPHLILNGPTKALWDGRFAITIANDAEGGIELRPLGRDGAAELRRLGWAGKATRSVQFCPSFWQGAQLVAVPPLGFWLRQDLEGSYGAAFLGLRYNPDALGRVDSANST